MILASFLIVSIVLIWAARSPNRRAEYFSDVETRLGMTEAQTVGTDVPYAIGGIVAALIALHRSLAVSALKLAIDSKSGWVLSPSIAEWCRNWAKIGLFVWVVWIVILIVKRRLQSLLIPTTLMTILVLGNAIATWGFRSSSMNQVYLKIPVKGSGPYRSLTVTVSHWLDVSYSILGTPNTSFSFKAKRLFSSGAEGHVPKPFVWPDSAHYAANWSKDSRFLIIWAERKPIWAFDFNPGPDDVRMTPDPHSKEGAVMLPSDAWRLDPPDGWPVQGSTEFFQMLVQAGLSGEDLMCDAIRTGDRSAVEKLLAAAPNAINRPCSVLGWGFSQEWNPLQATILSDKPEMARELIRLGADPRALNKQGQTAFAVAEKYKRAWATLVLTRKS